MPAPTHVLALATSAALLLASDVTAQPPTATATAAMTASVTRPASRATRPAPIAEIALEKWRTRWAITAVVGGQTRRYLFDTGGGLSFVSDATARAAGCTPWGRMTGWNMFGRRGDGPRCDSLAFDIAGRLYAPPISGLIDMKKLNPGDSALDGIVGLNVFDGQAVTLDLAAGRIVVESDASLAERVRGATPIPIRINREVSGFALSVFAGVPTDSGTLWMEIDSGNGGDNVPLRLCGCAYDTRTPSRSTISSR